LNGGWPNAWVFTELALNGGVGEIRSARWEALTVVGRGAGLRGAQRHFKGEAALDVGGRRVFLGVPF
jgi:hypothetical protein